jgi:hypothetical protein
VTVRVSIGVIARPLIAARLLDTALVLAAKGIAVFSLKYRSTGQPRILRRHHQLGQRNFERTLQPLTG